MEAGVKTIMITSVLPEEGKTTLSVNLATVLASAGKRVVLVSADMRRPRLAQLLSVSEEPGLAEILVDHAPISRSLHLPGIKNLQVVPSGRRLTDPSEWLGSQEMTRVLQELSQTADVVLLDATPINGMADALALAPLVGGVILVCGAGLSTAEEVHAACRKLNQSNARLIGSVLNGFIAYKAGARIPSDYYRTA
jgi:capsular exopolysaccharide synthesis family protein